MASDNILQSDNNFGIDLPEFVPAEDNLKDEKRRASFAKSANYKEIKEYWEGRKEFYKTYLPNGLEVAMDVVPTAEDWRVANRVNAEINAFLQQYEFAKTILAEATNGE